MFRRSILIAAFFAAMCGFARATDLCGYAANVNGYWGPGVDTRIQPCTGNAAWAILVAPLTLEESESKRWGLFASRDTTGIVGGVPGTSNGAILATATTGAQSTSGANVLMAILSDHAVIGGGGNSAGYISVGRYGTAPAWGLAIEAQEYNGPNPTEGVIPVEIAYTASGADIHNVRGPLQVIAKARSGAEGADFNAAIFTTTINNAWFKSAFTAVGDYRGSLINLKGANNTNGVAVEMGVNQGMKFGAGQIWNDGVATNVYSTSTAKLLAQFGNDGAVAFPEIPGAKPYGDGPKFVCINNTTIYASMSVCR